MSIKTLLFGLFLYVCLVWVAVAYLHLGVDAGLYWTGIGLIALLGFLILARIAGWWRLRRARAVARPAAPLKAPVMVHEDDAALAALLEEANTALAKAPGYRGERGSTPLCQLPVYLLIGPEGSGKTSTFINSGVEPQLLAGQVTGAGPLLSTRLCNVWLAANSIFIELAGRAFSGDIGRWKELLGVLRGRSKTPLWRRLWGVPEQQVELRAVIGFCDVREFTGASADPQRLERQTRDWQERLRAIADVFGAEFPVYQIITKCDGIPFFPEFFRRLPDMDAAQILGCTLALNRADALPRGEVFAEQEAKRLTASFRSLYHRLAARRIIHLAHEPDPAKRPAVYEFPRELKRIRSSLVQFLTDAFRPNALRPGPLLRGYYLSGMRQVQTAALDPGNTRADWNAAGLEATRLFHSADATQLFRSEDVGRTPVPNDRRGMALRWTFVSDLFRQLIPSEPLRGQQPLEDSRLQRLREYVLAGVCGVCALLCVAFLISWIGNRALLRNVEAAGAPDLRNHSRPPSLADLQTLEKLRAEVERLRGGAGLALHWGLYTGNSILEPVRAAYFRRFRTLLLDDLNDGMVSTLATVPDGADQYDPIYQTLQTHLIISAGCGVDSDLVSRTLRDQERNQFADAGQEWRRAADKHIVFYAGELQYGNPSPVPQNVAAREHARQYLARGKDDDAAYRAILTNAAKSVAKPERLADLAPDYTRVLTGPAEVNAAFTPAGWAFVEKASKEQKTTALDSCVTGAQSLAVGDTQAIQQRYLREYIHEWSRYLAGFSVNRYDGAEDAVRRLGILLDKYPTLALFAMTARQTGFQADVPTAIEKGASRFLKKAEKTLGRFVSRPEERSKPDLLTTASVTSAFQSVHVVVPSASPTVVTDKNTPYVDGLRQLRNAMQELALAKDSEAAIQAARGSYQKAFDAAQKLAEGFPLVDPASLNATVKRLLEEPIKNALPLIPTDSTQPAIARINGALAGLSASLKPIFAKYPFNRKSNDDVTLSEFNSVFAPASGSIWVFQTKHLADLVLKEKDHAQWKGGDPAKKPQVTPELLAFLNQAQKITDAFYPAGAAPARLNYSLVPPKPDPVGRTISLYADGKLSEWTNLLRAEFAWPATTGDKGARLRFLSSGGGSSPVTSYGNLWGIFRVFDDGEFQPNGTTVQWGYSGKGRTEAIEPPVQLEVRGLSPAATGVFTRTFFEGLVVPRKGAQ